MQIEFSELNKADLSRSASVVNNVNLFLFVSVALVVRYGGIIMFKKMLSFFQDWTLQIKYVQKRDAGLYECQVSSHPPTSIFIELNVVGKCFSVVVFRNI